MPALSKQPGAGIREPLADAGSRANQLSAPQPPAAAGDKSKDAPSVSMDSSTWKPHPGALAPAISLAQAADLKRESNITIHGFDVDAIELPHDLPVDLNCDQVRLRITRLLDSGRVKVGQFCEAIGVSNASLLRFRGQKGREKGAMCDAYMAAFEFLKKMEMAGIKIPRKKAMVAGGGDGAAASGAGQGYPDISNVHLDGEEDDAVEVYDTCDEVRKKITAYITKSSTSQAQFCRDLYAQTFSEDRPKRIQGMQLDSFRSKKGPQAGITCSVFYAAYVFFEKIRVAQGKAKSKHRLEMEQKWPGGLERSASGNGGYVSSSVLL
ncbi:hypothetical protein LTR78_001390 [Recurvomyces mirabilis]|uniref:DUF7726 domain-containing protein n=1 Tax=Recurvomyces mirabilis TaxID=574656 RepID=A0AAE0WVB5_9PEZI|nr:hypothetical protein LTR78_001390 [Recurvomyces mirabilis]KAK5161367.1 hypothetical protein LTS14_001163 [Recurvomyces mirabilis]